MPPTLGLHQTKHCCPKQRTIHYSCTHQVNILLGGPAALAASRWRPIGKIKENLGTIFQNFASVTAARGIVVHSVEKSGGSRRARERPAVLCECVRCAANHVIGGGTQGQAGRAAPPHGHQQHASSRPAGRQRGAWCSCRPCREGEGCRPQGCGERQGHAGAGIIIGRKQRCHHDVTGGLNACELQHIASAVSARICAARHWQQPKLQSGGAGRR